MQKPQISRLLTQYYYHEFDSKEQMISKCYIIESCVFNLHAFYLLGMFQIKDFMNLNFKIKKKNAPTTFVFLGCNNGFFGPLCSQKCPYPSFGKECQKICNCDNKTCDHRQGCKGMYHLCPGDVALIYT